MIARLVPVALLLVSAAAAGTKHKPIPPAPPPGPPDEIADIEAREANLESKDPRDGLAFAVSLGGGVTIGSHVGRGPALSLRLGHVATRETSITFELAFASELHRANLTGPTLTDTTGVLLAGAQSYLGRSTWIRGGLGLGALTKDIGGDMTKPMFGGAALFGGGLDLARWGYVVLGFETAALASLTRDGFKFQLGLNLGLSYY